MTSQKSCDYDQNLGFAPSEIPTSSHLYVSSRWLLFLNMPRYFTGHLALNQVESLLSYVSKTFTSVWQQALRGRSVQSTRVSANCDLLSIATRGNCVVPFHDCASLLPSSSWVWSTWKLERADEQPITKKGKRKPQPTDKSGTGVSISSVCRFSFLFGLVSVGFSKTYGSARGRQILFCSEGVLFVIIVVVLFVFLWDSFLI